MDRHVDEIVKHIKALALSDIEDELKGMTQESFAKKIEFYKKMRKFCSNTLDNFDLLIAQLEDVQKHWQEAEAGL